MITLIAAIAKNRAIGKSGQLIWTDKDDMARFKRLTTGKIVIMGRKTWDSIPESYRPLPHRQNVIITRNISLQIPDGVERLTSITEALTRYKNDDIMVIGGAEIYAGTIDHADCLELTEIAKEIPGDTFFPLLHPSTWKETARINKDGFSFVTYHKVDVCTS